MRPLDPEKREKILTTAIALFLKKGYRGTTTAEIGRRAGMSSAHMYTYFKNKKRLLVEAVRRMEAEHIALSAELAKNSAGSLDDKGFIERFYGAQAKIRHRVRFIASCVLAPETAALFNGYDFDYSGVFMPFLKDWPEAAAKNTARALMAVSLGYFMTGNINVAKEASLSVLRNARALL